MVSAILTYHKAPYRAAVGGVNHFAIKSPEKKRADERRALTGSHLRGSHWLSSLHRTPTIRRPLRA